MQYVALVWAGMASLFLCMLAMAVWGHRFGRHRVRSVGEAASAGSGIVEGALFALLGLLIAFTFATSYSRFNIRRDLAVQEANAIGTAYLRLDVLSASKQPEPRAKFRDYIESRLAFWRHLGNASALSDELKPGKDLQSDIWTSVIKATEDDQDGRRLLLPALNEMIDITTTRLNAIQAHPPPLVFVMLFALALLCAWLVGHAMSNARALNWAHVIGYAAMVTLTIYVIIDFEFPRYGLIRLDFAQEALKEVRDAMR